MSYTAPDGRTYRVADAHAHIFKEIVAQKASDSIGRFYDWPMASPTASPAALLASGSAFGIERYLVFSAATTPEQVSSINRFIAAECAAHPEFIGLGTAHPGVESMEVVADQLQELGLGGLKLHPDMQRFNIDDARMMPLYRICAERGLSVTFHVGDARYDYSSPARLARVLDAVPALRCHAAHFGCCFIWRDRPIVLADYVNSCDIVFDTSSMLGWAPAAEVRELVCALGADHLMFGTDFPMWDHENELRRFFALGLSPEQNQQILFDTFARFYGVG